MHFASHPLHHSCPRLERLCLHANALTEIPRRALSKLDRLRELRLDGNAISQPANLAACARLVELDLSANGASSIKSVAALRSLIVLRMNDNEVGSRTAVCWLQFVSRVCVDNNLQLASLGEISRCPKLQELSLTNNKLRNPKEFANLTSINVRAPLAAPPSRPTTKR